MHCMKFFAIKLSRHIGVKRIFLNRMTFCCNCFANPATPDAHFYVIHGMTD